MAILITVLFVCAFIFLDKAIYAKMWDKKLHLRLRANKNAVFEGEIITLDEEIENGKLLPLPWVEVYFELSRSFIPLNRSNRSGGDYQYRIDPFGIPAGRRVTFKTDYQCANRGFYKINNIRASASNLMMTDRHSKPVKSDLSITVYPKVISVNSMEIPYKKLSGEILARRFIMPDPFEFRGIREYQPYDSFKNINFKASARTGELMSNVFDFTVSQEIVIILNLQQYSYVPNWLVNENAIRLAAFLARYYIGAGIPAGLLTNGCDAATGAYGKILPGRTQQHLTGIYETLARINLLITPCPIIELVDRDLGGTDKVYVLISSYCGEDLKEWFSEAKRYGSQLWIVPYEKKDDITVTFNDSVVGWEVSRERY